ncbi:MAG: galactose oxidase early set domain-containing protein [Pseudomonadota bacterium]
MTVLRLNQALGGEGIDKPARLLSDVFAQHPEAGGSLRRYLEGRAATDRPWEVIANNSTDMAVHAALLHTAPRGNVLYFGGTYHADFSWVHDIAHDVIRKASTGTRPIDRENPTFGLLGSDLFCSGHAFMLDGTLLVAGGQLPSVDEEDDGHQHGGMRGGGERRCFLFRPAFERWFDTTEMNADPDGNENSGGRWYPALINLDSGLVLAVGGHPDVREDFPAGARRHSNNTPELYHPIDESWEFVGGDTTEEDPIGAYDYHRIFQLPGGDVFFASNTREANRLYNPQTGRFRTDLVVELAPDRMYQSPPREVFDEDTGELVDILRSTAIVTAVMLPLLHEEDYVARFLIAGDVNAYICDFGEDAPRWRRTHQRDWNGTPPRRFWSTGVLLPTGEIFIAGGCSSSGSPAAQEASLVLEGEICRAITDWSVNLPGDVFYDIDRVGWRTVERAHVGRRYHGTALLLPDGTVWTGGSNGTADFPDDADVDFEAELRIEVYRPDYCREMDRADILEAPERVERNDRFSIAYRSDFSISRVVFIRNGSATHGFNGDQRYITLDFEETGTDRLRATAPPNFRVAPSGYYMLWLIDSRGLPCRLARFVHFTV